MGNVSNLSTGKQTGSSSQGTDVLAGILCSCVCRLDRLASGVLVIARTTEKAALFHKHLRQDFIEKEYLARVKASPL